MWRVVIGTNNIDGRQPHSKKMKVKAIIIHPDFDVESYENDIALFHLKKAVRYNDYIQPICLPFGVFQRLNRNTKCFISGWGRTKEEGNYDLNFVDTDFPDYWQRVNMYVFISLYHEFEQQVFINQ